MAALTTAKSALRKEIKGILKNIGLEERKEQSAKVFRKVSLSLTKIDKSIILRPEDLLKRLCSDKGALYKAVIFATLFIHYLHLQLCLLKQYQLSKRISLYLSTKDEIDTLLILKHIFDTGKEAFVPQYHGKTMEMVKVRSMEDYETLPLTKWSIKQPSITEQRENALETGKSNLKDIFHNKAYLVKFNYLIA